MEEMGVADEVVRAGLARGQAWRLSPANRSLLPPVASFGWTVEEWQRQSVGVTPVRTLTDAY